MLKRSTAKRKPSVAGRFYTSSTDSLRREIEAFVAYDAPRERHTGCVVPHAGYMFSGPTAGKVLGRTDIPAGVVILSPNHTGAGADIAVWDGDEWETPLGETAIATELRDAVLALEGAEEDAEAHMFEHSIEVIIPFLQVLSPETAIVPVTIRCHDLARLTDFGEGLSAAVGQDVLVIASSDMTHMESAEAAREKDMACIEKMEAVEPEGLFELVTRRHISMCGVCPVTVLLACCRKRGIQEGRLIEYTNSGKASGDFSRVVGYAGMVF